MAFTISSFLVTRICDSPSFHVAFESKFRAQPRICTLASGNSTSSYGDSVGPNDEVSFVREKKRIGSGIDERHEGLGSKVDEEKKKIVLDKGLKELDMLWEDGFGTKSVKDYFDIARDMIRPDGGPPRWFCPIECGHPIEDSPILLFLPGLDGVGLGLILHHKTLGRVFQVRCLHIPVYDRTPFEGLVKLIENTVRLEHAFSPNKPIYLVGDSFGGCLALSVAARNPAIDLLLILSNPATSFSKSLLQPLLTILEAFPNELLVSVPYLLSFIMGNPIKMAMVSVENGLSPAKTLEKFSGNLSALLLRLSGLVDIIPRETFLWRLKLLKSAAAYANSRLHTIKTDVLVLASGKDNILPSSDEAQRLLASLQNCTVRYYKDNGHTLLMEDGIHLLAVIKGTLMYRRSRRHNYVSNYLPPSMTEFNLLYDQWNGFFQATSPVMLSTMEDGQILRGLAGVPNEGPVLLVGYHMLTGIDLLPLAVELLREKKIRFHGMAHPAFFSPNLVSHKEFSRFDTLRQFGGVPVSASNFYRLLSTKSFILLYPGGAREALHLKGEEYKLFWPDQSEFVRMAAQFGAKIVPFGVVGEDDIIQLVFDRKDLMKIPFLGDWMKEIIQGYTRLRTDTEGEVANQELICPAILPKIPGRLYYLFGKPIETNGREEVLKDRRNANALYLQIKSQVENILAYLVKKREEDPYRGIMERTMYRAVKAPLSQVPAFEP